AAARGKSNEPVTLLDSTGRAYAVMAHTLPSARGHGEPLTGRLNPPDGASFEGILMGGSDERYVLASDAGYGFVTRLGPLQSRNKSGKAVLKLPENAWVLPPVAVPNPETDQVAVATNEGRLLLFPARDLPEMTRGKGNKLIAIPAARAKSREEVVVAVTVVPEGGKLTVYSGRRHVTLKAADLEHYQGERGRRGHKLPRGFQRVDGLELG
ncbi:MAG TPA: DNA gyrase C-terminal beta-propeller domain-containing protein, partial [Gammaproteobacteria bacterium]|nr:DNA gyrase C-terminal beta-propeller domain-containing protein [Gammaproteobacteria bacterium]